MNCLTRFILSLGALVIFAGSLFAADTIELKNRLIAGKKYYWSERTEQTTTMAIPGQTMENSNSTTTETSGPSFEAG